MLVSTSSLIRLFSLLVFEVMSVNWSSDEPFSVHVIFVIAIPEAGETAIYSARPPIYTAVSPLKVAAVMKKRRDSYVFIMCKSSTYYLIMNL